MATALRIAYDGTLFDAYARDPHTRNVEECLIEALRAEGFVEGSFRTGSRTDKGVSALENVVRVELDRPHLQGLVPAVQSRLPDGLWITGAAHVPDDWNPRHAGMRQYRYVAPKDGEDMDAMAAACAAFVGEHDMRAFARVEPPRNPVRVIDAFDVEDGRHWAFTVRSPGFLWNQVRRMVDAVQCVGAGHVPLEAITDSLETGVPHPRFGMAPPHGLTLERVAYDLEWADAGRLPRPRVAANLVQAMVRQRLAEHLAD